MLIVTLLFAALAALLLGSYLSLNLGTARLSRRAFDHTAAFHLAEAGLEEGLLAYNRQLAGATDAWDDWHKDTGSAWRAIEGFALTGSSSGKIKIHASPLSPGENDMPTIVALAEVGGPASATVSQMIEVKLRRRTFFSAGLVALEQLVFRGSQASFDSWNSDPDHDPATEPVPYSTAVATDTGTIGTATTNPANLAMRHARVHGYFRGAGVLPEIGPQGFIGSFHVRPGEIEPDHVGGGFLAAFPIIPPPEDGVFIPTVGDALGEIGRTTSWRTGSLQLSGRTTLTILGDVTLVLTASPVALTVTGSASIIVPAGSSLTIYTAGDVQIAGRGIVNEPDRPASLQIWSTVASSETRNQTMGIYGRGKLSAVLYAPHTSVTIAGDGDVYGSIVAREIVFAGGVAFHYDEALAKLVRHAPFGPGAWSTVDDPARRAALLPLFER